MSKISYGRMRLVLGLLVVLLLSAGVSFGFPTWIGVYGAYERHASGNPGTFTILMNQDYSGLHAEVGVQINGGEWNSYEMSYDGNVEGNSVWVVTPGAVFPAGATVTYYFHGYDDWGDHIYDSDNGNNYSFTTSGGGGTGINWGPLRALPTTAYPQSPELAAYGGEIFAVWSEGDYQSTSIYFSKNPGASDWQPAIEIANDYYPHVAVSSSGIHLIYGGSATAHYIRSTDGGASWSSTIDFSGANYPARYAKLAADDDYIYMVYNDYTPPETSKIYFRRMHKDATAWESPVLIYEYSGYKTTVTIKDLEVRGNSVAVSSYSSSWYGGYSTPRYHDSADGGANWTEYAPSGSSIGEIDADDSGAIYRAAYDYGPSGGGLYFQSKSIGGAWSSWNNVWPGSGTIHDDGLRKLDAGLVAVSRINGLRYSRVSQDNGATWGNPELIDSSGYYGVDDAKSGTSSMHLLVQDQDSAGGGLYSISTETVTPTPLEWAGSTYHWPLNGDLTATDDLWINIESYPIGAGVSGRVHYSTDGVNWMTNGLSHNGVVGANDAWHANLGTFPGGTEVQYAVVVSDGLGTELWDNNNGQDYIAEVSGSGTVYQPVFWALDPYRFDNELVRANGIASDAGDHGFGSFDAAQNITIRARPVENGNGNLVQDGVTMTSVLHYTLTGLYDDTVSVTGTFHAAGFSSNPVFDYFSYDLGTFNAGQTVTFWLEATNSEGAGYAQEVGADYWITITGGNSDSDGDGLPDSWETDYFSDLDEIASGDNIIEYAIGLNPTVPNDPMGIRLLWSPSYPEVGDQVTLSYFYVNEGNPLFGKPVYAHIGHDGWQDVYDTEQLQLNGQITRFETTITVPAGATELDVVFHDNAGTWDNNSGTDWFIPIKPTVGSASLGEPTAKAPAEVADEPAVAAPEPVVKSTVEPEAVSSYAAPVFWDEPTSEPIVAPTPVKELVGASADPAVAVVPAADMRVIRAAIRRAATPVEVVLAGRDDVHALYMVIGHSGWTQLKTLVMTRSEDGLLRGEYCLPAGAREVNLAFLDGEQNWDLNDGDGWSFTFEGNGSHQIEIQR